MTVRPDLAPYRAALCAASLLFFSIATLTLGLRQARGEALVLDGTHIIHELSASALSIVRDPKLSAEARVGKLRRLYDQYFERHEIARFIAASAWRDAKTPAEQQELIEKTDTYVFKRIALGLMGLKEYELKSAFMQESTGGSITVATHFAHPKGHQYANVKWRMRPASGHFKITDVVVEGFSLALTERSALREANHRLGGTLASFLKLLHGKIAALSAQFLMLK